LEFAPGSFQGITLSGDDISNVKRVRARREVQRRPEMLPVDRRGAFDLVQRTLTESDARREAERCLQCSTLCDKCVEVCPNRANYTYAVSPLNVTLPRILCQDAKLTVAGEERFAVEQVRQIIHVDEFCNECGNCATFCVHEGEPYREKPRLFLTASGFHAEADNAFYVEEDDKGWTIKRREDGKESWLSVAGGAEEMVFENDRLRVTLSPSDFSVQTMELKQDLPGVQSLVGMAEMYVILKGITASLPFLPFGKP